MGQINNYCYHGGPLSQKAKDAVFSYAFNAYAAILSALVQ